MIHLVDLDLVVVARLCDVTLSRRGRAQKHWPEKCTIGCASTLAIAFSPAAVDAQFSPLRAF